MDTDRYIAAVEVSSSKILGVVTRTKGDGSLDVIAVEQEKGVESVKYGIIQNLEETSMRLRRIIEKMERHPGVAPRKIKGVFVGLSGRSLRSITTEVSLSLPDDTEITDEIIERLKRDAMSRAIDNSLEVVDAVPCVYVVDKTETQSPKGVVGKNIKATFELVVCRPEMKRNLTRTITDKVGVDVDGFIVTALATSHLILTAEEKRLGCMLVDLGAETTTVTIFRNGVLKYFATLPMGGRNITRDLTSLSILEERAEDIKCNSGSALAGTHGSNININGIAFNEVNNIIVARSEEIVANIVEQIEYAGMKETDIPGGIICIGGGASLGGIMELLSSQSNLPVQLGRLPQYVHMSDAKGGATTALEAISIAYSGATLTDANCLEIPEREEMPELGNELPDNGEEEPPRREKKPRKSGGFWNNITDRLTQVFSAPPEDNSDLLE